MATDYLGRTAEEAPAIEVLPYPREAGREAANDARAALPARLIVVGEFAPERKQVAKPGFSVRHVPADAMRTIVSGALRPRSGDLVLAVIERVGYQSRIELPNGRKARLMAGDEIVVAYADRYAPDQFEAHVPSNLGVTQLVASGGIAAQVLSKSSFVRDATRIRPVGLVGDDRGRPLNIADFALPPVHPTEPRPPVIAVVGTSMNSGKTTTITHLIRGLSRAGRAPGAAKVTGTGSGNDYWVQMDAGAHRMLDFTDAGFASTYRIPMAHVERIYGELLDHLTAAGCGALLIEIADGIYQQETARLIDSDIFRSTVDGMIFAAGEAMGAVQGVKQLQAMGLPVMAVSGRLTSSPLAAREAREACGVPVLTIDELHDPQRATGLLEAVTASQLRRTLQQPRARVSVTKLFVGEESAS